MSLLHTAEHLLVPTILLVIASIVFFKWKERSKNLPPSPPSLPIIGHLHLLSLPLHHALRRLSNRYGPVLLLRFGSRSVLIVSSPSAVDECFVKHDITFADRPHLPNGKYITYNYTALAAASYGPSLRNLRRVATVEIFSPARIRSLSCIFNEEARLMIKELLLNRTGGDFTKVDMKTRFSEFMFNVIMKVLNGKRYFGTFSDCVPDESRRFRDVLAELFSVMELSSAEDFLPFLKWFGFKGYQNRLMRIGKEMDLLLQDLIEERRRERGKEERTIIDVLLSLQEADRENHSDELIKGMILTIIAAGTHTTSGTLEWALTLLLNHPEALHKTRDEISEKVGEDRLIDYSDVQNLGHLNNVIKETLRLFPAAPLLLPHESSSECTVQGFTIPRGTMLFANAYAIHRDPAIWEDAATFKPERFEGNELRGSKIYFPFGLGRRSCPGDGLGMVVVGLALGALIQCFEWEGIDNEIVDISEGSGLTISKSKPLEAMCRPRKCMAGVINKL